MSVLVWCLLFLLVLVMLLPQADIFSGTVFFGGFFLAMHNFLSFKEVGLSGSQMGSRYRPFGRPAGSSGGELRKSQFDDILLE